MNQPPKQPSLVIPFGNNEPPPSDGPPAAAPPPTDRQPSSRPPVDTVPTEQQEEFLRGVEDRNQRLAQNHIAPQNAQDFRKKVSADLAADLPQTPPKPAAKTDSVDRELPPTGEEESPISPKKETTKTEEVDLQAEMRRNEENRQERRKTKEDSVGDLKRSYQAEKTQRTAAEARVTELEARLATYTDVDSKLEEVTQLRERVKQLEPLEKVFRIHEMPEFQAKVGAKNARLAEAKEIAEAYQINTAVVDQALKLTNPKEFNDFLAQNVRHPDARQDIKNILKAAQGINAEIEDLQSRPEEAQELLSSMVEQNTAKRREEAVTRIKQRQKTAWTAILNHYGRGENAVPELMEKPGDVEHTKRREKVLNISGEQFGLVMAGLANAGATDVPEPLAKSIASHYQLGSLAAELLQDIKVLRQQNAELQEQIKSDSSYRRPNYNGQPPGRAPETKEPQTTKERTDAAFTAARDTILSQNSGR